MDAKHVAKLVEKELSRARGEQVLECLHSAERLIRLCIEVPESASDRALLEEMLKQVKRRIKDHHT